MKLRLRPFLLAAFGSLALVTACQEHLTAPGTCPATCPGGTPVLRDTVLDALVGQDSTHTGYFAPGTTLGGMRIANGLNGATDYGVIQFLARDSTLKADSTQHTYVIDSIAIEVSLMAHDSTVSGLRLELRRMPLTADSLLTFAGVDGVVVPGTLIDSVTIADSVRADSIFRYRFVFRLDTTPNLQIPPADSGRLQLAISLAGPAASGVRMGGIGSGNGIPIFWTYVTVNTTDTTTAVRKQLIKRGAAFTTFVSNSVAPAADSTILAVGTPTGARALIRFPWPAYLRDSALLARATLELVPEQPINGLQGDSAFVDVFGVFADFGAKSPITGLRGTRGLILGSSDTVKIDVISELSAWQSTRLPHPPVLVVSVSPEGTSFTEPRFYSTRQPVAVRRPRLRITYQAPFDFERP